MIDKVTWSFEGSIAAKVWLTSVDVCLTQTSNLGIGCSLVSKKLLRSWGRSNIMFLMFDVIFKWKADLYAEEERSGHFVWQLSVDINLELSTFRVLVARMELSLFTALMCRDWQIGWNDYVEVASISSKMRLIVAITNSSSNLLVTF